jgi:hypothetical protein
VNKREINIYISGFCSATVIVLSYLIFTNGLPFMSAAGVGTGAADINAKYHDGYATSLTAGSGVIYISDGSNYLPAGSISSTTLGTGNVGTTNIADSAITSVKISDGTIANADIADGTIKKAKLADLEAGDSLMLYSDGQKTNATTSWVKEKEALIHKDGTVRVKFDMRGWTSEFYGSAQIYLNGSSEGTLRTNGATYTTYSEDISVSAGDLLQLYLKSSYASATAYTKNFRIYDDSGYTYSFMTLE